MAVLVNIVMTSSTTVGEANLELERRSRRDLWARAVFAPLFLFALALGLFVDPVIVCCRMDTALGYAAPLAACSPARPPSIRLSLPLPLSMSVP